MNKVYQRIVWENYPSENTPLNETNLNRMDYAVDEIDSRVVTFDTTKANQSDLLQSLKNITYNDNTGIFTFTWWNGSTKQVDLNVEKIPVSFSMSPQGILTMTTADGTKFAADIASLIKLYTFNNSTDIHFNTVTDASGNKTITAFIVDGSVTESKLQPNFLADCREAVLNAQSAQSMAESANTAAQSAKDEAISAKEASEIAQSDAETSASSALLSKTAAETARINAENANTSAQSAKTAAETAQSGAELAESNASSSASSALNSATQASNNASAAAASESNAEEYSILSKSWAQGGTGARIDESTNNAKYWAELAASYAVGGMHWMGSINFSEIPSNASTGDLYNIKDEFTTDSRFDEGSGILCPAGTDIVLDNNGKWDVLVPAGVISFNGRKGNVIPQPGDYTKDMVGLNNVPNVTTNDQTPTFTQSSSRSNIASGEKLSVILGKIMKFFADLKTVAFSGSYNDLSDKPTIPTKTSQLTNDGQTADCTVTFTSSDVADGSATAWTTVSKLESGEKHSSIFAKVSQMFKNIRYLYKILGTTDLSTVGNGTVTDGIKRLSDYTLSLGAKNLLRNIGRSMTIAGITFTINDDGSVTANGTCTYASGSGNAATLPIAKFGYINLIEGETYALSGCPTGGSNSTYKIKFYNSNNYSGDTSFVYTKSSYPDTASINIMIYGGVTVNNLTFYPMIRHASIKDSTFTPFAPSNEEIFEKFEESIKSLSGNYETGMYSSSSYEAGERFFFAPDNALYYATSNISRGTAFSTSNMSSALGFSNFVGSFVRIGFTMPNATEFNLPFGKTFSSVPIVLGGYCSGVNLVKDSNITYIFCSQDHMEIKKSSAGAYIGEYTTFLIYIAGSVTLNPYISVTPTTS